MTCIELLAGAVTQMMYSDTYFSSWDTHVKGTEPNPTHPLELLLFADYLLKQTIVEAIHVGGAVNGKQSGTLRDFLCMTYLYIIYIIYF